mmetsp:Transcript_22716/g.56640  ORF Transcript_22716/g.56640 Transcript_22716/m.56640 type:complete len:232 (-) Transcript_22716:572-1267(-)
MHEALDLDLVVQEVQRLRLPPLEPLLVRDLGGHDGLSGLANELDQPIDLRRALLPLLRVHAWEAFWHLLALGRHGEHVVDLGVQLARLVIGGDLAQGLATGVVVHRTTVGQLPVHVLVVGRLHVPGLELLRALRRPSDRLCDHDEVGGLRANVCKVALRHFVRDVRLEPDVEDSLRAVVVPHARDKVSVAPLGLVRQLDEQFLVQVRPVNFVLDLDDALKARAAAHKLLGI